MNTVITPICTTVGRIGHLPCGNPGTAIIRDPCTWQATSVIFPYRFNTQSGAICGGIRGVGLGPASGP